METAEQAKRSFKDSREEARRILESPNRAYELLNLIGVRDELLGALQRCATLMKNGFIPPENIGKDAEEIVSGDYANGWDAACEEFRNSQTAEIAQAAIAKAEGRR